MNEKLFHQLLNIVKETCRMVAVYSSDANYYSIKFKEADKTRSTEWETVGRLGEMSIVQKGDYYIIHQNGDQSLYKLETKLNGKKRHPQSSSKERQA